MPMFKYVNSVAFIFLLASTSAFAFDGTPSSPVVRPAGESQSNVGRLPPGFANAIDALMKAAEQGDTESQWQLGRMFAKGDGVNRDDLKAFNWFSQIVENHADDEPTSPQASYAQRAFLALGSYYLAGIPGTEVKQDFTLAWRMFYHAASVFGDSEGQFQIGRMYLDGSGVDPNPRMAANWLRSAADKGHIVAQATLGELIFVGRPGLPRRPVEGLGWLTIARERAKLPQDAWVVTAFEDAFTLANINERSHAARFARRSQALAAKP